MSIQSGYKQQQNLSLAQLLSEVPAFIVTLTAAILTNTMLLFVDLMDSFGNLLRSALVTVLSKKLSNDLRFEYNYGIGKIESVVSLFCNGIVFFGLLITIGLSAYSTFFPEQPSDLILAVAGIKVISVCFDATFFVKQRKILNSYHNAISETNCAAALATLLLDCVTLVSLLVIWLLRTNPIGRYISPAISIFIAFYLMCGCIRRTKSALEDLTDKTLPEEVQMKILSVLTRFYDSFSQLHSINSHRYGNYIEVDLQLSFDDDTSYEEIANLKKQMQQEFYNQLGNCIINVIVRGN